MWIRKSQNETQTLSFANLNPNTCQRALAPLKTDDELDLYQINLHHSLQCNIALKLKCKEETNFLYSIQEPYQDKYYNFTDLAGGNCQIIANEKEKVRAAILHSRNLPIIPVQQLCTKDLAAGMLRIRKKNMAYWQHENILIISSYWDILINNIQDDLQKAISYAEALNMKVLIQMDSNAHSQLFGSPDQNARGDILEQLLADNQFVPINQSNEWTFHGGRGKSVIDVTFASADLASNITEWRVITNDTIHSDHKLIQMKLVINRPVYEYGRDLSKVNWQTFRNELNDVNFEQKLPKYFTISDLEESATDWERRVRKALDCCTFFAPIL